jgi:hypothetical protein
MSEKWLPVPEFEGLYEESDQGRIRSIRFRNRNCNFPKIKMLSVVVHSKTGYCCIGLKKLGMSYSFLVHRLVLMAFSGPCPEGMQAAHQNGVRSDNRLANLKWKTPRENNVDDKKRHGTFYHRPDASCPTGHEYSPANTKILMRRGKQFRQCVACAVARYRRRYGWSPEEILAVPYRMKIATYRSRIAALKQPEPQYDMLRR